MKAEIRVQHGEYRGFAAHRRRNEAEYNALFAEESERLRGES